MSVRGAGLLLGLEFGKEDSPSREVALRIMELARERGLLLGLEGGDSATVYLRPPLCLRREDASYAVEAIEDALGAL